MITRELLMAGVVFLSFATGSSILYSILPPLAFETSNAPLPAQKIIEAWKETPRETFPSASSKKGSKHALGNSTARYSITLFANLQSPASRAVYRDLRALYKEHPSLYSLTYKHFPESSACDSFAASEGNDFSCFASVLTECAHDHGKFWEAADELSSVSLTGTSSFYNELLDHLSTSIHVPRKELESCTRKLKYLTRVKEDAQLGRDLRVTKAPSLWINNRRLPEQSRRAVEILTRKAD